MRSPTKVLLILSIALFATPLCAQYRAIPSRGAPYASIAGTPGAFQVANCDDCTATVTLSFAFPWFDRTVTQIEVSSNGSIFFDGSTTAFFEARSLGNPVPERVSVAQEDLDPRPQGGVWVLDRGDSLVVSYEGVGFWNGTGVPPVGSVEAQIELFSSSQIELRYGTMDSQGNNIVAGLTGPLGQSSPNRGAPEFGPVTGRTSGGVHPQNVEVGFAPSALTFQTNSAESELAVNGLQGTPITKAVTRICTAETATLSLNSSIAPTFYELAVSVAPIAPVGLVTRGNQVFNLDLFTTFFVNGGPTFSFQPFVPANLSVSLPVPIVVSAQLAVLDASAIDGLTLSQPIELRVLDAANQAGPTADDESLEVGLVGLGACSNPLSFCGTNYGRMFIDSNGRLLFNGATASDFSPTVAEALTSGFVGHWTDFNPATAGTVSWSSDLQGVEVRWAGVPYFAEPATTNDLVVRIDLAGQITVDVSGIAANPQSNTQSAVGDAVFFGLSCGPGATDAGATAFSVGGAGGNANATDMVYDFIGTAALNAAGGLLPSVSALQAGQGQLLLIPGAVAGQYTWIGF